MRNGALLLVDDSTAKAAAELLGPTQGRKEKRIILSYAQRLTTAYGVTRYRFPAGHNMDLVKDWSFAARVKNAADLQALLASID